MRFGIAEFFLAVGDRQAACKEVLELLKNQAERREGLVLLASLAASEVEAKDVEQRLDLIPENDQHARIWHAKALLALGFMT